MLTGKKGEGSEVNGKSFYYFGKRAIITPLQEVHFKRLSCLQIKAPVLLAEGQTKYIQN